MEAVQRIAEAAGVPVVLVDNAIWLLCAKSGLYMTNPQLKELRLLELSSDLAELVSEFLQDV